jgi:CysZ protein
MEPLGDAGRGAWLLAESIGLLRRERSLWRLAALPITLSAAACLVALAALAWNAGALFAWVAGFAPEVEARSWWEWLWVGPAKLALHSLTVLAFLAVAAGGVLAAWLLAGVAAAPFLEALSRRVEELVAGGSREESSAGLGAILRDGGRAVLEELRRTSFFLALWLLILAVGALIPGAQLVAPVALALVTWMFLPLDYAGPALDRRRLRFRTRRRWVLSRPGLMLGFGGGASLAALVPGLNLLCMPALVVAGTLLVLRYPPAPEGPEAAASPR